MRALVTGCSTGIGRATAVELTRRGIDVVATARDVGSLADLDVAAALTLDVADEDSVHQAAAEAGDVDVLVSNAAFGVIGPVETVPLDGVRDMYETNVFGTLRMIQAFVPPMRARGRGHVVLVSSIAGRMSVTPLNGLYASTKHALEALGEALWVELRHFGVGVSLIEPGYVATSWSGNEQWMGVDGPYEELYRQIRADDLDGQARATPPAEVGAVIADAVEEGGVRLRWPGTPDAGDVIGLRTSLDDPAWEQLVLDASGLDW